MMWTHHEFNGNSHHPSLHQSRGRRNIPVGSDLYCLHFKIDAARDWQVSQPFAIFGGGAGMMWHQLEESGVRQNVNNIDLTPLSPPTVATVDSHGFVVDADNMVR
jgi:hypothetical protein